MNLRDCFFSYRSFTPIPIVFILLYFTEPIFPFLWVGFGSVFIGEYIRFCAVRYAGGVTRTRKVGAPSLCTSGPYAHIRNPLYLGNMVIYMGVTFIAGGVFMWEFLGIVFIYFTIQYVMIISLEEETLSDLFGTEYDQYKINVPRFIPRITLDGRMLDLFDKLNLFLPTFSPNIISNFFIFLNLFVGHI